MDLLNLLPRPTVDLGSDLDSLRCRLLWMVAYCWTRLGDSDYSEVLASKPDREGFLLFVGATCAGATTSSAEGLFELFIALSAG